MSTAKEPNPESAPERPHLAAEQLHSAAIHLLRRLRRFDGEVAPTVPGTNLREGQPDRASEARGTIAWTASPARLSALSVIVFSGPITLGRLAQAEQVRPPTMTRIVHALEAQGLVTKSADPDDRRTLRIAATMRGKRLLLQGRNRRIRALAAQIAALSPADQAALRGALPVISKLARLP